MIHTIGNQITNIIGNRFHSNADANAHKNNKNNHSFISSDKKYTIDSQTLNIILIAHIANNHNINRNISIFRIK